MRIYIYALKCPIDGAIRYIGKSINPEKRLRCHLDHARTGRTKHHTGNWLAKLLREGLLPEMIILHEVLGGERWQDVERSLIAKAQANGLKLTNSTAGGEGLDYIDPEAKAKYAANISARMKEFWNRPERKIEVSRRFLKAWANPEFRDRRAASLKAAFATEHTKERLSAANTEINARPEVKAIKSKKLTESWATSHGDRRRAAQSSDESRAKMSERAKARWSDPAKSAALMAKCADPESRRKKSEAAIRRATPEYRAAAAERTRLAWQKRKANG